MMMFYKRSDRFGEGFTTRRTVSATSSRGFLRLHALNDPTPSETRSHNHGSEKESQEEDREKEEEVTSTLGASKLTFFSRNFDDALDGLKAIQRIFSFPAARPPISP
ncbi:MAG: hypothetical protein HY057_14090 [Rhodospirillales bacterium]|nr:hypothetical protein [Rhodospirillales bacterium]